MELMHVYPNSTCYQQKQKRLWRTHWPKKEKTDVNPNKLFLLSNTSRGRAPSFTGETVFDPLERSGSYMCEPILTHLEYPGRLLTRPTLQKGTETYRLEWETGRGGQC